MLRTYNGIENTLHISIKISGYDLSGGFIAPERYYQKICARFILLPLSEFLK